MDTDEYLEIASSVTEPKKHNKRIIDTGVLNENPIRKKNPYKQESVSDSIDKSQTSDFRGKGQVSENIKEVPSNEEVKSDLLRPKPDFNKPISIGDNKSSTQPFAPFKPQGQSQGPIPSPFPQNIGIPSNNKPSFQLGPKEPEDVQNKPKEEMTSTNQGTFISTPPVLKPQPGENAEKIGVSTKPGTSFPFPSGKTGQGIPVQLFPGAKSSEEPKNPFPSSQPSSSSKPFNTFAPKLTPPGIKDPFPNPQNPPNPQFQGPKPFQPLNNPPSFPFGPKKTSETIENPSKPPEIFSSKTPSTEKLFPVPQNPFPGQTQQAKPGPNLSSAGQIPFGTVKTQETNNKLTPGPIEKPEESLPKPSGPLPFLSQPPIKNTTFPFPQPNQSGLPFGKPNPQNVKTGANPFPSQPIPKDPSVQSPTPFNSSQTFKTAPTPNIIPNFPSKTVQNSQTPNINPNLPFKPINKIDPSQKSSSETSRPIESQVPKDSYQENKDLLNKNLNQNPFNILQPGFKPNTSTEPVLHMKNSEGSVKTFPGDDRTTEEKESKNMVLEGNKEFGLKTQIPLNLGVKSEDVNKGTSGLPFSVGKSAEIKENTSSGALKTSEKEVPSNVSSENPVGKDIRDPIGKPQNFVGIQPQPFKIGVGSGPGLAPSNIFGSGKGPEPNQKPFPNFGKPSEANPSNILPNENPFGSKTQDSSNKIQLPLNPTAQTFKPGPAFSPFGPNKNPESNQTPFLDTKKSPFPVFIKPIPKENPIKETPGENPVIETPKEIPVIETPKETPKEIPKETSKEIPKETSKEIPSVKPPNMLINPPFQTFKTENVPKDSPISNIESSKKPEPSQTSTPETLEPSKSESVNTGLKENPFAKFPNNPIKGSIPFNTQTKTVEKPLSSGPNPFNNILNPVPNQKPSVDENAKTFVKSSPFPQVPKENSSKPQFPFSQPLTTGTNPTNPFAPIKNPEPSQKPFFNPPNLSEPVFSKDQSAEISALPKFEPKDNSSKINPPSDTQSQIPKSNPNPKPESEPEPVSNSKNLAFKSIPLQNTKQGQFPSFIKTQEDDNSKTHPTEKPPGPQQPKPEFKPFISQPSKEPSQIPSSVPSKNFEPSQKPCEEGVLKTSNLEQPIKPIIAFDNPKTKLDQVPQNPLPPKLIPDFKPPVPLTPQFPSVPASPQIPILKPQSSPLNPQVQSLNTSSTPLQNLQKPPQNLIPTHFPSVILKPTLPSNEKPTPDPKHYAKSTTNSEAFHLFRSNLSTNAKYIIPMSIPSIKTLPKKINQDSIPDKLQFINLLLTIISPEKSSQVKDQIFAVCPNIKDEYPDIYDLITKKLNSLCFCNLCRTGQTDFELKCGHKLCELCARTKIINLTPEFSLPTLGCPLCYNLLSYQSLERIFPKNQSGLRYDLEARLVKEALENENVQCKKCAKDRNSDMFVSESCMHMCKECIATSIRWQVYSCEYCDYPFQAFEDLSKNTISCDGCGHQVYYIGDYVKKLNDGHFLCSECLRITLLTSKCQQCSKSLTSQELIEIDTFLYDHCAKCGIEYGITNFKILQCCKNHICDNCFNKLGPCSLCLNQV